MLNTSKRILHIGLLLLASSFANAYSVSPIIMDLSPSGPGAKKTVEILNDSDEPIAIELSVAGREISSDGKESIVEKEEIEKAFGIYPAQVVLKPKSTRTIQLQYLGKPDLTKEEAYRLIVEEVTIGFDKPKTKKTQGGVEFLVRYHAAVYVKPKNVSANIEIKSIKKTTEDSKELLVVELLNKGNAHQVILNPKLNKGGVIIAEEKDLPGLQEVNILAGHTRTCKMPWPTGKTLEQLQGATLVY